jgi:hypothetical protein
MKISKRFTDSVKLADGSLKCFTTEIEGDDKVLDTPEKIIEESDKIFAQCKWLVERDQEKVFGTGEQYGK